MVGCSRRSVLSRCGVVFGTVIAGCQIGSTSDTVSTHTPSGVNSLRFELWNEDADQHRLTLGVTRDGSVLFDRTYTLTPKARERVDTEIETPGTYRVTVQTAAGNSADVLWKQREGPSSRFILVTIGYGRAPVTIETGRVTDAPSRSIESTSSDAG